MSTDRESAIAAAIDTAGEFRDPLDELVERATSDAGAPFEEEAVKLLQQTLRQTPADYERTIEKLRAAKVRIGSLEKLIKAQPDSSGSEGQSGDLTWPEDEAWDKPVDGEGLLDDTVRLIERHLVLPDHSAAAIALWVAFSHSLDLWQFSPRLAFISPEKRCGKTTALALLQHLVPRALPAANITPAAVFRTIDAVCPTLLIDEADTFLTGNDELRGVLNCGHNRAAAFVVRLIGDDYRPARFGTWAPVAIAMIGKLPDTLHDRAVVVPLKRKKPSDVIERCRFDRSEEFIALRRKFSRWVNDNRQRLQHWDGEVPSGLHDRAADNWRPLLAIAYVAGGHWPAIARQAALALTDGTDEAESVGVLLLRDIRGLFARHGDRLATQTILDELHNMDDRRWPDWRQGKPITAPQLARLLKPFGITSKTIRLESGQTPKGFKKEVFADAFARYLPDLAATPPQVAENCEKHDNLSRHKEVVQGADVAAQKEKKPQNSGACGGVAAGKGEPGIQDANSSHQEPGDSTRQKAWGTRL
jgi:putative DNA primase/helicase